jgi:hypothetical protein
MVSLLFPAFNQEGKEDSTERTTTPSGLDELRVLGAEILHDDVDGMARAFNVPVPQVQRPTL